MMENIKRISRSKKAASAILAGVLSLTAASSALVLSPNPAHAIEETRTYTWANGSPQPNVPNQIEVNGQILTVANIGTPVQADGSSTASQYFAESRSQNINASSVRGDVATYLRNAIPATYHIDQDGFVGDIPRTGFIYTPISRTVNHPVSRTESGSTYQAGGPRETIQVTEGGQPVVLTLDRNTLVMTPGRDSSGEVIYNYTATYNGSYNTTEVTSYKVDASYGGTLTKVTNNGDWSVNVLYFAPDPVPAPPPSENQNNENRNNENQNQNQNQNQNNENQNQNNENQNQNQNQNNENANNENGEILGTPVVVNENVSNNENTFSNGNVSNANDDGKQVEKKGGFPIAAVILGAADLLAVIFVGSLLVGNSRRKKAPVDPSIDPTLQGAAAATALIPPAVLARRSAPVDPELECKLIELFDVENQKEKAVLDIRPSRRIDVPTIIPLPAMGGNVFEPEDGAAYYVGISDISGFQSDEMIVVSAEGQTVYEGQLVDQFKLDTDTMTAALNCVPPDGVVRKDISMQISDWAALNDEAPTAETAHLYAPAAAAAFAPAAAPAPVAQASGYPAFPDEDDDLEVDLDEESPGVEQASPEASADGIDFSTEVDLDDDIDFDDLVDGVEEAAGAPAKPSAEVQTDDILADLDDIDIDELDDEEPLPQPTSGVEAMAAPEEEFADFEDAPVSGAAEAVEATGGDAVPVSFEDVPQFEEASRFDDASQFEDAPQFEDAVEMPAAPVGTGFDDEDFDALLDDIGGDSLPDANEQPAAPEIPVAPASPAPTEMAPGGPIIAPSSTVATPTVVDESPFVAVSPSTPEAPAPVPVGMQPRATESAPFDDDEFEDVPVAGPSFQPEPMPARQAEHEMSGNFDADDFEALLADI